MTFVPAFPIYPPETAWMREPRTDIPGLVLNAAARRRAHRLPARRPRPPFRARQPARPRRPARQPRSLGGQGHRAARRGGRRPDRRSPLSPGGAIDPSPGQPDERRHVAGARARTDSRRAAAGSRATAEGRERAACQASGRRHGGHRRGGRRVGPVRGSDDPRSRGHRGGIEDAASLRPQAIEIATQTSTDVVWVDGPCTRANSYTTSFAHIRTRCRCSRRCGCSCRLPLRRRRHARRPHLPPRRRMSAMHSAISVSSTGTLMSDRRLMYRQPLPALCFPSWPRSLPRSFIPSIR